MNTIINDDCFNAFDKIEGKSIDLVVVDLPYGQTDCKWDSCINLERVWDNLKKICKDECQYVFFTTTKFGVELILSNPSWFRYDLVWEKIRPAGFLSAKKQPLRGHEMMYVFSNPKIKGVHKPYNPQKTPGKPYKTYGNKSKEKNIYGKTTFPPHVNETGDRYPISVLNYGYKGKKYHRTQKPLELCQWLIKTYSNEGSLVLDFCMGSGTTIVACINTNRNYIGIEKDEEIFNIAKNRINLSCPNI
jgi:site-specific DNA-methyltransferase (adenine-specific)